MTQVYVTGIILALRVLSAGSHCTGYGVCNDQYVPAPPGHTPRCARPGSTFCEDVDHYPRELIWHLLEKWRYDFNTLLMDESTDDFSERKPLSFGHHQLYGAPAFGHPPLIQPAISYGPINATMQHFQGEYPDRRYKIEPYFLMNALQHPGEIPSDSGYSYRGNDKPRGGTFQSHDYSRFHPHAFHSFKRFKRSKEEKTRKARQAAPFNSGSLCPTRASFIMPRAALNNKGNWMYTVNLNDVDSKYTQLVRSETCISNQCNNLCTLPNGYSSQCQQQYVQKRLVALEANGQRLYSDVFWFPHCCICQIIAN